MFLYELRNENEDTIAWRIDPKRFERTDDIWPLFKIDLADEEYHFYVCQIDNMEDAERKLAWQIQDGYLKKVELLVPIYNLLTEFLNLRAMRRNGVRIGPTKHP